MNDLRRQIDSMHEEISSTLTQVVAGGHYVLGPNVTAFENEFSAYCGVRHCVGVANGTDALELALRALNCGPGRDVITVANAGMYAAAAILAVGARPVFVDIDLETMTMSPASLASHIDSNTAAIVVTHLYGRIADMDGLITVAARHRVPIVEDCAQAHGAERAGRKAGSMGMVGCFSFYPTKNLGALGDGGAVTTNDDAVAQSVRRLRQYGWRNKYESVERYGRNSRLDELQAAVLRVKLPKLGGWNARRREIVRSYRRAAGDALLLPDVNGTDYAAHLCVIRTPRRDALRALLTRRNIAADIHYPIADHRQEALRGVVPPDLDLPNTAAVMGHILTLPCFPEMRDEEVERVCDALASFGCENP